MQAAGGAATASSWRQRQLEDRASATRPTWAPRQLSGQCAGVRPPGVTACMAQPGQQGICP